MNPVLELREVRFAYPDGRHALSGVDLVVAPGERVALLGPNGAGKTTLALHLNGTLRAAQGTVVVDGVELADGTVEHIRRLVGMVFQDPADQLFMPTVREDVAFGPANLGMRNEALASRVDDALRQVGAGDLGSRAPHHLSGGEKRAVAIATALAMDPAIVVLDEPSSGLDPAGRRELADMLAQLDGTLLVITHDLPFASAVCHRSVILDGGVVVADGRTETILTDAELLSRHRLELPFGYVAEQSAPATGTGA